MGTGEELNVSCATAALDPPHDELHPDGVRRSLEPNRAIGADATRDANVEGLWHRLRKRDRLSVLVLPSTNHAGAGDRAASQRHRRETTRVRAGLKLLDPVPVLTETEAHLLRVGDARYAPGTQPGRGYQWPRTELLRTTKTNTKVEQAKGTAA